MAVWGGLTNSCEKKRGGKQRKESQRKEMQKNAQTTAQLHSSHMLVK